MDQALVYALAQDSIRLRFEPTAHSYAGMKGRALWSRLARVSRI